MKKKRFQVSLKKIFLLTALIAVTCWAIFNVEIEAAATGQYKGVWVWLRQDPRIISEQNKRFVITAQSNGESILLGCCLLKKFSGLKCGKDGIQLKVGELPEWWSGKNGRWEIAFL